MAFVSISYIVRKISYFRFFRWLLFIPKNVFHSFTNMRIISGSIGIFKIFYVDVGIDEFLENAVVLDKCNLPRLKEN